LTGNVVTTCLTCKAGYYLLNNICVQCPVGCAVCTSSSTCTVSQNNFVILSGTPSCDSSLNLYLYGNDCQQCSSIFQGCFECVTTYSKTACNVCNDRYFLTSTGSCSPCNSACLTCTNSTGCTSCPDGYTLASDNTCQCLGTCLNCISKQTNCVGCTLNIFGNFSQCTTCAVGYYLNTLSICEICPLSSNCYTCGAGGICLSCPLTY
jgi:hypothetical protein